MIITKSQTGATYTIDMESVLKTTYASNVEVKIDGTVAYTAITNTLPYTWSPVSGVYEIIVKLTAANSATYTEKRCYLVDDSLHCKVIVDTKETTNNPNALLLYYLLDKGSSELNCACSCDGLKSIYTDLNKSLNHTCCL